MVVEVGYTSTILLKIYEKIILRLSMNEYSMDDFFKISTWVQYIYY